MIAEAVKMPEVAESISDGTLKQWVKKVGDYVEADEEVASVETDKVSSSNDFDIYPSRFHLVFIYRQCDISLT